MSTIEKGYAMLLILLIGCMIFYAGYDSGRRDEQALTAPVISRLRLNEAGCAAREGLCSDIVAGLVGREKFFVMDGAYCFECHGHGG